MDVRVTWHGDRTVNFCLNGGITVAATLWGLALGMLAWDTIEHPMGLVGRWGLLVGMVAGVWTIALLLRHHRSVMLEVMSFEHRMQGMGDPSSNEPGPRGDPRRLIPVQRD